MNTNQLFIALVIFAVCIKIDAQTTKHPVTSTKKAAAPITLTTSTITKKDLLITSPTTKPITSSTTKPITKSTTKTNIKPPVKRTATPTTRKTSSRNKTRTPTPLRGSTYSRSLNLFSRSFALVNLNTTNNNTKAATLNNDGPSSIIGKPSVAQLPVHEAVLIKLPAVKGKPVDKISEDDDELDSDKKNRREKQGNENGDKMQNNNQNKHDDDKEEKDD